MPNFCLNCLFFASLFTVTDLWFTSKRALVDLGPYFNLDRRRELRDCRRVVGHKGGLSSAHPYSPGEKWCVKFVTQCQNVAVKFTKIKFAKTDCEEEFLRISWGTHEKTLCDEDSAGSNWMDKKVLNGTTFALEFLSGTSFPNFNHVTYQIMIQYFLTRSQSNNYILKRCRFSDLSIVFSERVCSNSLSASIRIRMSDNEYHFI